MGGRRRTRHRGRRHRAARRSLPRRDAGGAEFHAEFEQACAERGIALHVLPPRSPKLNAIIESFNGTFRRECLNRLDEPPADVAGLAKIVRSFLAVYHNLRPHQALGWRTPAQCHTW